MSEAEAKLAAYRKAKADVMAAAGEIVKGRITQFFETHPDVISVHWEQYTPYFNDGEPCVFGVYSEGVRWTDTPSNAGEMENGWDDQHGYYDDPTNPRKQVCAEFAGLIEGMEDILVAAFEDHVEVTILRDGTVTVDEYEHD